MSHVRQGEIWWAESPVRRRPVLVVTRTAATPVLTSIVVAPVTSTIRGIPTEVALGRDEGLAAECVASFDNLRRVHRSSLTTVIGRLPDSRRHEMCAALAALADC